MASFDEIKLAFWDKTASHGVGAPLTDERLAHAERELGVTLPDAYVELLRLQNGGGVAAAYDGFSEEASLESLAGVGPTRVGHTILDSRAIRHTWEMPDGLVLLEGDGHTWVALDYRRTTTDPPVVWWDNDEEAGTELAPDFRSFVEALRPLDTIFDDSNWVTAPSDRPPSAVEKAEHGALSAAIRQLAEDVADLHAGRRGMDNTKKWCRARAEPVFRQAGKRSGPVNEALREIKAARDPDELERLVSERLVPELERLMPYWIDKRLQGYALDEEYLREQAG
ncbi:MAG: hypothetical protein AVDCRST_MAG85-1404 [uncultured Solirubrobacteraceae bacterium]|uniref:Knr4/Smi1-like domain-containing protein n=1 Tax=uncultured Solirubrobacteraceae bacterium TaxID=1162706 RepID=A0A6J4SIV3_9ACTN|nr:MAG: hypothetical protein AVDCRST_MAG85-1404 [uncultured Solirubrobacteraceae bacterium]